MAIFLIIAFIVMFMMQKFNPHLYFIESEKMFVLWYNFNKERRKVTWKMWR